MTLLIEVERAIFDQTGHNRCSECSNQDGTVTGCDWCGKLICIEHDFQPGEDGYDSDLVLCEDCGNQYRARWWRAASIPLSGVGEWRARLSGGAFQYELHFSMLVNPAYEPKPAAKTKKRREQITQKGTAKPTRQTKPAHAPKPKRVKLTPEERKERARTRAAATRQQRKRGGLRPDCPSSANEGQTRCADCAEKHRRSR